ncbi:MAG: glycerophosphodiester phosphodiesterase [Gemmatimonadetes bacterium]|nr:glycerophosphodiester phosphodiesterase [Gemmatimonadota bacterium]
MSTMLVIGHRGASGHALENTLDAFERCVAPSPTACDGVELDVHTTADGELVVHHDPALADGRLLHELTAAEVAEARLKDGSGIPTLAEALAVLSPIEVFIEAKGVSIHGLGRLRALMAGHPFPERLHVHAFDHRVIRRLYEADATPVAGRPLFLLPTRRPRAGAGDRRPDALAGVAPDRSGPGRALRDGGDPGHRLDGQ